LIHVDEKDCIIYRILNMNGRVKLTTISEALSFSPPSTKERLDKLIKNEEIAIKALLNVKKRGYKTAVCCIRAETMEDATKLADALKDCPRVVFAITSTGAYNLIIALVAKNADMLQNTIENDIRPLPGIKGMEVSIGDAPIVPEFLDIRIVDRRDRAPCGTKPCNQCYLYERKCEGCPATNYFLGLDSCPY
jgi:DNA-binding Lrp family transcriptional regulator